MLYHFYRKRHSNTLYVFHHDTIFLQKNITTLYNTQQLAIRPRYHIAGIMIRQIHFVAHKKPLDSVPGVLPSFAANVLRSWIGVPDPMHTSWSIDAMPLNDPVDCIELLWAMCHMSATFVFGWIDMM